MVAPREGTGGTRRQTVAMTVYVGAIERDVVTIAGSEATDYLQGQISQDVQALGTDESAWTFVLSPQGKVDGWGRLHRVDAETYELDVDPGAGEGVATRLRRFLLRTKATVEPLAWRTIAVRNPGPTLVTTDAALVLNADWHGQRGFDLLGATVDPPLLATRRLADNPKAAARDSLAQLAALGIEVKVATGDNAQFAEKGLR